jgi:glucokinase
LAGDIGGTKTVLALFGRGRGLTLVREETFASRDFDSLEDILARFLSGSAGNIEAACFGVAGPVRAGRCQATNLPWSLCERELGSSTRIPRVRLLNDLEAAALGMLHLKSEQLAVLQPAREPNPQGHIAVIAAGTGLGEAMLVWDGAKHVAVASEGGHASFAPRSEEEIELLRFLRVELGGHVSVERVCSGLGLRNVYHFAREKSGEPEPESLASRMQKEDVGAVVGELGMQGGDPVCARALDLFLSIYGNEAGAMALRCVASRVILGGGIAPKLLPALQRGGFLRAFSDKGRFRELLEGVEVSVCLEPRAPLFGAAHAAAELAARA